MRQNLKTQKTDNKQENIASKTNKSDKKKPKQKSKIKSWYSNRYQIVVVQRNILFFFALLLSIAMTAAIIFVKLVVSSKSLEPYVIEVEEKSGIPTVVDQITTKTLTADESVKKYFINQFIQSAVGYNPRTYKSDAEKIRLFSTQNIYSNFRSRINPKKLGIDSKITVQIKSIRFLGSSTVEIRVKRNFNTDKNNGSKNEVIRMNYYFTNLTLTTEERLINPLGFQVTNFSISEEIYN